MLRSMLATAVVVGLAAAAGAQDVRPTPARDFRAHHARFEKTCEEVDGLSLCVQPPGAGRSRRIAKQKAGELTRFTRLAGMFMGRVDAADLGPLKVRFKLEIQ